MKEWILVAAMMGVLLVTAYANDATENNDVRQDLRQQRHAYFLENIKPKIDASRKTLEVSITAEDKKEITRIREDIVKQKLLENEFRFELRNAQINGEKIDDGLITELSTQRIVIENLYDKAKVIANKYRPQIDELLAGIEFPRPNFNKRDGNPQGRNFNQQGNRGQGQGRQGMQGMGMHKQGRQGQGPMNGDGRGPGMHGQGFRGNFGIVSFLLWDSNRNFPL